MNIQCFNKEIESVLRENYLKIPRFQRPYSWDRENIEEFWYDITESGSDYFIGSIVVYKFGKQKPQVLGMVDGQQRFTTITILLCVVRNLLFQEGFKALANGVHRLIERPDIENRNQYTLQAETSYPFLQEHIQKYGPSDEQFEIHKEEAQLKAAYEILEQKVNNAVKLIKEKKSITERNRKKAVKTELTKIRDIVLGLKLIHIYLDNEDDAYIIFETLNTRGKDLTLADLVKNHITKLLKTKNVNVDRAKERWNNIRAGFEASQADININSYIHHYWLSRYDYVTEKKVFKKIKRQIRRNNAKKFLQMLEDDAGIYRVIHEPSYWTWRIEQVEMREALEALILFKVKQQLPMIMSVIRNYNEGQLPLKRVREMLIAIENFHFIFTAVTSQRSSGGISFMYAKSARELMNSKRIEAKNEAIKDLKYKLRNKIPVYQEFEANFAEILVSEKFTKQRKLGKYILGKMTSYYSSGIPLDMSRMTIEHLSPQSRSSKSNLADEDVASLGNLILVDETTNSKLSNKSFQAKMRIIKQSNVWVDDFLKKQKSIWGKKQIEQRTKHLAKLAYEKVWKL